MMTAFIGCKQTQADRFERYLEEANDTTISHVEFITPGADSVAVPADDAIDPYADDDGIYTIPDIPQERDIDMNANNYELERMMMGRD